MSNSNRSLLATIIIRAAVVVFLLAAALGVFEALKRTMPKPQVTDVAPALPRVLVMEARPTPIHRQWTGYGTASSMQTADVPARVSTTVLRVPENIIEGAAVETHQLLAELDDSDFARQVDISAQNLRDIEAQLNRLEVEEQAWSRRLELANEAVEIARGEFNRFSDAQSRGAANQREVDQSRQALLTSIRDQVAVEEEFTKIPERRASLRAQQAAQEASLRLARLNVERSKIRSPIAGILQSVDVEAGESVMTGERIARVVNVQRIEVPLRVPSSARAAIGPGDTVELSSTGAFARTWNSKIARIAPEDDESTRTMTAYVELEQHAGRGVRLLAPGTYVSGRVTGADAESRFIVPRRAVSEGQIRLVENNIIVRRRVESDFQIVGEFSFLGVPDRLWVALRDPLSPGALVVINGATAPPDGTQVEPVLSDAAPVTAMDGRSAAP